MISARGSCVLVFNHIPVCSLSLFSRSCLVGLSTIPIFPVFFSFRHVPHLTLDFVPLERRLLGSQWAEVGFGNKASALFLRPACSKALTKVSVIKSLSSLGSPPPSFRTPSGRYTLEQLRQRFSPTSENSLDKRTI